MNILFIHVENVLPLDYPRLRLKFIFHQDKSNTDEPTNRILSYLEQRWYLIIYCAMTINKKYSLVISGTKERSPSVM